MWRELLRILNEAAVEGLSQGNMPSHERAFYSAIRHSNEVFAAFKVHSMGQSMAAKLLDGNGNLKPFHRWVKDVSGITSHHVGVWLKTEYNTAVLRAHAAADWRGFVANKDVMPNLRWMPTTSPDAEASHRAYWEKKLTLPVEHPFWAIHHPQDRWNCKCSLEATNDPASPFEEIEEMPEPDAQRGLENNPGKDGKLINDTHPYFPENCNKCPFYKPKGVKNRIKAVFTNRKKDCCNCEFIDGSLPNKEPIEINEAKKLVQEVIETKRARSLAYKIGELSSIEAAFIKKKGITLESLDIHISDKAILHTFRDIKVARGASVSKEELNYFLENINNNNYSLYWHEKKKNLTYVTLFNGRIQKFVVELNYRLKANKQKFTTNNFITAGELEDIRTIQNDNTYIKIR